MQHSGSIFFNIKFMRYCLIVEVFAQLMSSTDLHTLVPVCRYRVNIVNLGKLLYSTCTLSVTRGKIVYLAHETSWLCKSKSISTEIWQLCVYAPLRSWECYGLYKSRQRVACRIRGGQFNLNLIYILLTQSPT